MERTPQDTLPDEIYEAAFVPEFWPRVLDRLGTVSGSVGGNLFVTDHRQVPRWTASPALTEVMTRFVEGEWISVNPRPARAAAHPGFVRDIDLFAPHELEADPMRNGLLLPLGLGWEVGAVILTPTNNAVVFSFERRHEFGPHDVSHVRALDAYRGHLARAGLVAARLALEHARTAVATLEALRLPAAVLGPGGKMLAVNPSFQALGDTFVTTAFGGVALKDASANKPFAQAVRAVTGEERTSAWSVPLRASGDRPALVLHVVPLRRAARDIFGGAMALVLGTSAERRTAAVSADLLHGLFDLTPAEARLARALAQGASLPSLAASMGVSRETLRTQLRGVLSKTGTRRQGELAVLLASLAWKSEPEGSGGAT